MRIGAPVDEPLDGSAHVGRYGTIATGSNCLVGPRAMEVHDDPSTGAPRQHREEAVESEVDVQDVRSTHRVEACTPKVEQTADG